MNSFNLSSNGAGYNNDACEREEDKLPYIRLHDLRHTSATLFLAMGTDIETVKNRMGHSRASITLDVYGHALPSVDLETSEKLSTVFEEDIGKKMTYCQIWEHLQPICPINDIDSSLNDVMLKGQDKRSAVHNCVQAKEKVNYNGCSRK